MRLYIVEIQLTKISAVGADVVGKTMKSFSAEFASLFSGDGARKPLLEAPTTITHRSKVPVSPTGRFILRRTYWHTWSSFITQIIVIELQLVAFTQSKTAKQLSWLLN